jgi:2-iminobutanoate/2-iminopropanoate deaminase
MMKLKLINPATIPQPQGNYSQGIVVESAKKMLFVSGQIPENLGGEVPTNFKEQCETVWFNIGEILKKAGMSFENIVKVTTFLTNKSQIEENSQIRQRILHNVEPALTVMIAETLVSDWLLEIEVVAAA